MSRLRIVIAAAAVGLLIGVLIAASSGEDGEGYRVRAIFDNASFIIPGEDVKIAGVKVGAIADVDLTEDNHAAVVLQIDDPAFTPFRRDAHCQIRLQSLIGEQYVECEPTQPRDQGDPPPPLREIKSGRGAGEHLLPVDNNTTPVAVDLINNVARLPQRDQFRLIISELGAGLAGNGDRLRAALRRSSPALREFDEVVRILAEQDRLLARLVEEGDTVMAEWAPRARETAGFIDNAGALATATAQRGDDLERNFERLPAFLREFKPTADQLTALSAQMTPAFASLERNAPQINQTIQRFSPFLDAAGPALTSLGDFADAGIEIFPAIQPLAQDLGDLGGELKPTATDAGEFLGSFDDTGGIEALMQFIFFYTNATNGKDQYGHYLRSVLDIHACAQRTGLVASGCESTFVADSAASQAAAAKLPREPDAILDYLLGDEEEGQ